MTIAQLYYASTYPATEILCYMEQQSDLFEQVRTQLITEHLNQYVWFENGQVLDSDPSHEALVLRIYGQGEPRPLFIRKVIVTEPKYIVRSSPNLK